MEEQECVYNSNTLTVNRLLLRKLMQKMVQKILSIKTISLVLHCLKMISGTTAGESRLFLYHFGKISAREECELAAMPSKSSLSDLDNTHRAFLLTV